MAEAPTMLVFATVDGSEIAIPADDILALWRSKNGQNTLIERLSDTPDVEVLIDFDKLLLDSFNTYDLRPKKKKVRKVQFTNTEAMLTVLETKRRGKKKTP